MRRISIALAPLAVIFLLGSAFQSAKAQQGAGATPNFGLNNPGWAEVLSVTPKWVVLQSADGRQYPVSSAALGRFIVRWPILPPMVSATALVEAEGQSPSVNTVLTNSVEVYEGAARGFVSPTYITPTDAGILRQYDATYTFGFDSMNQFWSMYPSQPAVAMQNVQLMTYIVAPVVNIFPLMLGTPSNQAIRIAPANGQAFRMTRIVVGSLDQLRPGDLVYAVPNDANNKSMALSVMIVYKKDYPVITHN
ncbi:MAG: hypothetical protein WCJ40_09365 [Planctomycetota bacterium]|nr:hypothetical protein [Planctomycetota bacterium]